MYCKHILGARKIQALREWRVFTEFGCRQARFPDLTRNPLQSRGQLPWRKSGKYINKAIFYPHLFLSLPISSTFIFDMHFSTTSPSPIIIIWSSFLFILKASASLLLAQKLKIRSLTIDSSLLLASVLHPQASQTIQCRWHDSLKHCRQPKPSSVEPRYWCSSSLGVPPTPDRLLASPTHHEGTEKDQPLLHHSKASTVSVSHIHLIGQWWLLISLIAVEPDPQRCLVLKRTASVQVIKSLLNDSSSSEAIRNTSTACRSAQSSAQITPIYDWERRAQIGKK